MFSIVVSFVWFAVYQMISYVFWLMVICYVQISYDLNQLFQIYI